MSDDEEFCFRPARRTAEQKKEDLTKKMSAPPPLRSRPEHGEDAGTEEGRQRAMELYNKELNDRIIFMGDDADALYETIKAHQGENGMGADGQPAAPSAVVYGIDLSYWPPNKPVLVCAAEYGRTEIVRCLVRSGILLFVLQTPCSLDSFRFLRQHNAHLDPPLLPARPHPGGRPPPAHATGRQTLWEPLCPWLATARAF